MKATLPEITDEKIQYETIDMLRFPLICLVVLVHSAPVSVSVTTTGLPLLSDYGMLNFFYYCPLNFKDSKNVWLER